MRIPARRSIAAVLVSTTARLRMSVSTANRRRRVRMCCVPMRRFFRTGGRADRWAGPGSRALDRLDDLGRVEKCQVALPDERPIPVCMVMTGPVGEKAAGPMRSKRSGRYWAAVIAAVALAGSVSMVALSTSVEPQGVEPQRNLSERVLFQSRASAEPREHAPMSAEERLSPQTWCNSGPAEN